LHALLHPQSSTAQQALSLAFGVPTSQKSGLIRPGYYIETGPRLPKGYRWKKIPKFKKNQSKAESVNVCPYCNIPMVLRPNMLGQLIWQCPKCGTIT